MKGALHSCLLLLAASACAPPEEAYLTLQVSYAQEAQGKFGLIELRRNSGPPLTDGPFAITADALQRRIAIHAEGSHELEAELELTLSVCDDAEGSQCPELTTLELENVFQVEHTTELCFDFASLAPGDWPDKVDVAAGSFPAGFVGCSAR